MDIATYFVIVTGNEGLFSMKNILKAFRIGLPEALIIGFSLVMLYILIPMLINGGSVLIVESHRWLIITEIALMVATLGYGGYRIGKLLWRGKQSG